MKNKLTNLKDIAIENGLAEMRNLYRMPSAVVVTEANATEHKLHTWEVEASALRLAPGVVPDRIATPLGNKCDFLLVHAGSDRFLYRQGNGCLELIVWND